MYQEMTSLDRLYAEASRRHYLVAHDAMVADGAYIPPASEDDDDREPRCEVCGDWITSGVEHICELWRYESGLYCD